MKRILSIILCVAMLASMAAMSVTAGWVYDDNNNPLYGDLIDEVVTENVMTFTTDKDSYMPGENVVITAAMESIWGDPSLEGPAPAFPDDGDWAGAYGMALLTACVIYDNSVFTAKAHTDLKNSSSILNFANADIKATNVRDAKNNGAYNVMAMAPDMDDDDNYGNFNGSGNMWQYNLTISADAAQGTYYLPVGPYVKSSATYPAVIKFDGIGNDFGFGWNGQATSFLSGYEVGCTYKTNYNGEGFIAADAPAGAADYECAYIKIVIGEGGDEPITPPEPTDPMAFTMISDKTDLVAGDTFNVDIAVANNTGIGDVSFELSFNNTNYKLVNVTTPVAALGATTPNYDVINKLGTFESVGTPVVNDIDFLGATDTYTENGVVATLTFEVLTTVEGGESAINVVMLENGLEASVAVNNAGDHAHSFEDHVIPATCGNKNGKAGSNNKLCSCGLNYKISDIAKPACVPDEKTAITVPATCDNPGYTNTYCANCGELANTTSYEALGHDLTTIKTTQTCLTAETEYQKCQREGCKYQTEVVETKPAIGHKNPDGSDAWGEEHVIIKPTTSSEGFMGCICSICGGQKTTIPLPILEIKMGDCNMDEEINLQDVTVLLKNLAKWSDLYFSPENADVVKDGRVNVIDVTRLLQYIAGWDVTLGDQGTVVG